MAAGAENGEKSAVGRPSGRIWRIQGTPINTWPGGEAFVDVRAAESARNVLNGPYGGKNRPFWPFFDYFLQKRVASLTGIPIRSHDDVGCFPAICSRLRECRRG